MSTQAKQLPLSGIKVLEWGHTVMGPCCGLILADMGAEVIKIERAPKGDHTRQMPGFGQGFFPLFNRNKKSVALNLKEDEGKKVLKRMIQSADVFLENFAPGAADRIGFSYEDCKKINPRIIYCNLKGFMPGPYWNRMSLDNLVQMMGGLAFMTGREGDPLRVGASVTDLMGGIFGAMGIITALYERKTTGLGNRVISTLYESVVFMVAQHMACTALSGEASVPMPAGNVAFSVYDLFETADKDQVFIGVTSDAHWQRLCEQFDFKDLLANDELNKSPQRLDAREWLIPELQKRFKTMEKKQILGLADKAKIPYAPLCRPDELFDDPHLNESGVLMDTIFPGGVKTKMPKIPLQLDGYDFGIRNIAPEVGEYGRSVLADAGYSMEEIDTLTANEIVVAK